MSGDPITEADIMRLFEAARWAPSSGNSQPWRFVYARVGPNDDRFDQTAAMKFLTESGDPDRGSGY